MTNKIELTFDQIKELVKLGLVKSKKKRRKNGKTKRVISKKHLIRALEKSGHNVDSRSKVKFIRAPKQSRQTSSHMAGNVTYPAGNVNYPLSNVGNTLQTEAMRISNERAELDLKQQKEKRPVTDSKKQHLLDTIPKDNRMDLTDDELFNMYQNSRKKLEYIKEHYSDAYKEIRIDPSLWNNDTWEDYGALDADDSKTVTTRQTFNTQRTPDKPDEDEEDNISNVTDPTSALEEQEEDEENVSESTYSTQKSSTIDRFSKPETHSLSSKSSVVSRPLIPPSTTQFDNSFRSMGNAYMHEYDPVGQINVEVDKEDGVADNAGAKEIKPVEPVEHVEYNTGAKVDDNSEYDGDSEYDSEYESGVDDTHKEKIDVPTIKEEPPNIEPVKEPPKPETKQILKPYLDSWSTKGLSPEHLANFDPETMWGIPIKPKEEPKEEPPIIEPQEEPPIIEPHEEPPIIEPQEEPPNIEPPNIEPQEEPSNIEPPNIELQEEPPNIEPPEEQKEEQKEEPLDIFDDNDNDKAVTVPQFRPAESRYNFRTRFPTLLELDHPPSPVVEKAPKKKKATTKELAVIPEEPLVTPEKKPKKKQVTIEEPIKEIPQIKEIPGILNKKTVHSEYLLTTLQQIARDSNAKTNDKNDPYDKPIVRHSGKRSIVLYDELKKAGIIT